MAHYLRLLYRQLQVVLEISFWPQTYGTVSESQAAAEQGCDNVYVQVQSALGRKAGSL